MKLKHLYIALGLSALLTGCKDEEPMVNPTGEPVEIPVSFTIKLATESRNTRADGSGIWEDKDENEIFETDKGTDFDNTINSLTPVLYLASKYGSNYTIDPEYPVAQLEGKTLKAESIAKSIDPESKQPIEGSYDISGTMVCFGLTPSQLLEYQDRLRLAVFINCADDDVMNPLKISDPAQAKFNHHGQPDDKLDAGSKHFHGIPMYGVTGVKFFEETEDGKKVYKVYATSSTEENKKKISIPILRSMAKVRVKLQTDDEGNVVKELADKGVKLKELYIRRHAVQGYVVPKGWDMVTDVTSLDTKGQGLNPLTGPTNDKEFYNHDCTVVPQQASDGTVNSDIHGSIDDGGDYWANSEELLRFYLPDTYNHKHDDDESSKEIYLEITYTIDDVKDAAGNLKEFKHPLWFRPTIEWPRNNEDKVEYDEYGKLIYPGDCGVDTTPWDIIRNHIYEFVIEGVEASFDLKVGVSVKKWEYEVIQTEL